MTLTEGKRPRTDATNGYFYGLCRGPCAHNNNNKEQMP